MTMGENVDDVKNSGMDNHLRGTQKEPCCKIDDRVMFEGMGEVKGIKRNDRGQFIYQLKEIDSDRFLYVQCDEGFVVARVDDVGMGEVKDGN